MLEILGRHVPAGYPAGYSAEGNVRPSCEHVHCYGCDLDEPVLPGDPVYVQCGECFHVYRTSADLLAAWLEYEMCIPAGVREQWGIGRDPVPPGDAHQIWSCPVCNHDF